MNSPLQQRNNKIDMHEILKQKYTNGAIINYNLT